MCQICVSWMNKKCMYWHGVCPITTNKRDRLFHFFFVFIKHFKIVWPVFLFESYSFSLYRAFTFYQISTTCLLPVPSYHHSMPHLSIPQQNRMLKPSGASRQVACPNPAWGISIYIYCAAVWSSGRTLDVRPLGSKLSVFKSRALSSFISLPGVGSVAHKTLDVKKRR